MMNFFCSLGTSHTFGCQELLAIPLIHRPKNEDGKGALITVNKSQMKLGTFVYNLPILITGITAYPSLSTLLPLIKHN